MNKVLKKMKKPSKDQLKGNNKHLIYEIEMLYETANRLILPSCKYPMKGSINNYNIYSSTTSSIDITYTPCGYNNYRNDKVCINALIESFGIHYRGLFDFLYCDRNRRSHEDDIFASDYFEKANTWTQERRQKAKPDKIIEKINKQIAHLTLNRQYRTIEEKKWSFAPWAKELALDFAKFIELAPDDILYKDKMKEIVNKILDLPDPQGNCI